MTATIDLNADLGEGFGAWTLGDDDALMAVVTSANIACGFHAGDANTMRRLSALAVARGVRIGAHIGYPDLRGFGRRKMDITRDDLGNDVLYQLGALQTLAHVEGGTVGYLKPHGALSNTCDTDVEQSAAIIDAVLAAGVALMVLPGTELARAALDAGVDTITEAFPDRAYENDGRLRSRKLPDALIRDPVEIARRAVGFAVHGSVTSFDGAPISLSPQSLCLHGDSLGAVGAALEVKRALLDAGVSLGH